MIDKRLRTISTLIRKGVTVADIGTDHGYLPCYLVQNQIARLVYACDVNKAPLLCAKNHIKSFGYTDSIKTVLTDGLKGIYEDSVNDIVIAGMGGELIFRILTAVPWTARLNDKRYILQPMTHIPYLRSALYSHGFSIQKEVAVSKGKHVYTVMQVTYTGDITSTTDLFNYFGQIPESEDTADKRLYIKHVYNKLTKIYNGMSQSEGNELERLRIKSILEKARDEYDSYISD